MPKHISRRLSRIERRAAHNIHQALQETAQATIHTECDVSALMRHRERVPEDERVRLSTYVMHATLGALKEHPEMNAHLSADVLTVYTEIKLGLVVEVGCGVLVACIPDAAQKTHRALEQAVLDVITRARNKQLTQAETHGATFTIADLSAYAVDTFTPILLPSAIAILGIGRVRWSCVPTPQGYRPARLLSLSLTFDHRGCNGLRAGRFMTSLVKHLERVSAVPEVVCLN